MSSGYDETDSNNYPDYSWNDQDPEEIQDLLLSGGPSKDDWEAEEIDDCEFCSEIHDYFETPCACDCVGAEEDLERKREKDFWFLEEDADSLRCELCGHRADCGNKRFCSYQIHWPEDLDGQKKDLETHMGKARGKFANAEEEDLILALQDNRRKKRALDLEHEHLRGRILDEVLRDSDIVLQRNTGRPLACREEVEAYKISSKNKLEFQSAFPELFKKFFSQKTTSYLRIAREQNGKSRENEK